MTAQYLLRFWGRDAEAFFNANKNAVPDQAVEKDRVYCFWFPSLDERTAMLRKLDAVPGGYFAAALHSGPDVHKETVATMTLRYKGKDYVVKYGFGYGYEASTAEYYLCDGNGSCDCNRWRYIREVDPEFPEIEECGDDIELVNLNIDGGDTERDRRPDEPPPVMVEFTVPLNLIVGKPRRSFVLRNEQ